MHNHERAKVSVVIVSYNTRDLLEASLCSVVEASASVATEIIVVDNGSTDGSPEMVRSRFPKVRLLQNRENVGFARANNQAFPLCSGEYILLLNSDARLRPGSLHRLLEYLERHPDVGAVGPKVVDPQGRLRVLSCGYQPTLGRIFSQSLFLSALFPKSGFFQGINLRMGVHEDGPRDVEWLSGACLMVRREVIDQVGPLSEQWFMYAEDLEWCDRMIRKGWRLVHVPTAVAEHELGGSSAADTPTATMWLRSLYSYYRRRSGDSRPKQFLFVYVLHIGFLLRALFSLLVGMASPKRRAIYMGTARDFWAYALVALKLTVLGEEAD